jgi:hypothetical protein
VAPGFTYIFLNIFWPMPLFLLFNTQTMHSHLVDSTQQHCYAFPKKPYTLAGFEPVSFAPEAEAMSTAPRRQGIDLCSYYLHTYYIHILFTST